MSTRTPTALREFVKLRPEVEAVLQHIGRESWDLVLVDVEGTWVREIFESDAAAEEACRDLGIRMHRGWSDPRLAQRMRRRDHWNVPGGQRRAL